MAYLCGALVLVILSAFSGRLCVWQAFLASPVCRLHLCFSCEDFPANQNNLVLGNWALPVYLLYAHNQCGV